MRNLLAHVPKSHKEMIATTVRTVFAQPDPESTRDQLRQVVGMLEVRYPAAAEVLAVLRCTSTHTGAGRGTVGARQQPPIESPKLSPGLRALLLRAFGYATA